METSTNQQHYYAVILFYLKSEIGDLEPGEKDHYVGKPVYFNDAQSSLDFYANTPNPASQHLIANSKEDLENQIKQMIENYQDETWLEKNLYPFM